ncbi:hypothetical protein NHQ30_009492 [Ciborinia camelliae]|nr:hypothetical protein NHQ30_009492 [Ciborinia camelliae]
MNVFEKSSDFEFGEAEQTNIFHLPSNTRRQTLQLSNQATHPGKQLPGTLTPLHPFLRLFPTHPLPSFTQVPLHHHRRITFPIPDPHQKNRHEMFVLLLQHQIPTMPKREAVRGNLQAGFFTHFPRRTFREGFAEF